MARNEAKIQNYSIDEDQRKAEYSFNKKDASERKNKNS